MEETRKIGYRDVFIQKEYVKVIISNIINRFGDSVDVIAFEWLVYQITGSAAWSAIIFAVNYLPTVLLQPFAGALVEGMNKKRVVVITDCIRGLITAGLVVLYLTRNVAPWILVVFTLLNSTVEAFSLPAGMALIPKILDEEYYTYGTSLSSTISTVVQMIGLGAAGVIIGVFGIWAAILIDAFSFFGSAFVRCFVKVKEENLKKAKLNVTDYKENLVGGVSYVKNSPVVRNFCLLGVVINAVIVPMNALQTPLVYEVMGQGSELLSVLSVSLTAGMCIGSLIFPKLSERFSVRGNVVGSGVIVGIGVLAYTSGNYLREQVWAVYLLTIIASLVIGFGASIICDILGVQFMKEVKQEYLARAGAIFNASTAAAMPVTSFLISGIAAVCSVREIFVVSGLLCVLLFICVGVRKVRLE